MGKNINNEKKNNPLILIGLFVVCITLLFNAYILSRDSESDFVPASTEAPTQTETWDENKTETISSISEGSNENISQVTGNEQDNTQEIISENADETVIDFSGSTDKEVSADSKPSEKPKTSDDITNPDKQPEYDSTVPQTDEPGTSDSSIPSADNSSVDHPGQVYDPVFGWITTGDTNQNTIDSDGDLSKQVGTMN